MEHGARFAVSDMGRVEMFAVPDSDVKFAVSSSVTQSEVCCA